ncbi:DsrJ [Candidatus Sulfotelmatobacter kueseliae]|uniref:DsrJ n=1 Tax=Candidatus Sulfotelmatobacter kueseliae TaxID=2042962 RepID=A0A2U3JXU4_9BACT|nr:DsrJ [Candidatus Sulfotelmatobacter kueseliae]
MNDRPFILGGLIVFVVFVTIPVWRSLATPKVTLAAPQLAVPARETQCVAPVSYMRTSHMQLLQEWRDDVVRRQQRQYVAFNGRTYQKDLTRTCLSRCHGSRKEFCDRCHEYNGVTAPDCWNCHSDALRAAGGTR